LRPIRYQDVSVLIGEAKRLFVRIETTESVEVVELIRGMLDPVEIKLMPRRIELTFVGTLAAFLHPGKYGVLTTAVAGSQLPTKPH
jgi:hypothetical protein